MIVQRVRELMLETPSVALEVENRIYPVQWPDAPTYPLIILQRATARGETTMLGEAGIEYVRLQVDVYDFNYAAMSAIALEVRRLLHGFKGGPSTAPCVIDRSACINSADLPVPNTERAGPRLRRRMLEFDVWNREV